MKDYIIIFVLIVILVIVVRMMKTSKDQNAVLMAVALKTGAVDAKAIAKSKVQRNGSDGLDDEEEQEDHTESEPRESKKVKLKKVQRQTVSLFEDNVPKQIGELRDMYMARFSDIDKTKFYNTLYNLRPSNTLNFEKIDNKNYWGLGEWFDQDGSLYEEYAEKIPSENKLTIITNE